jgi:hypothetical protein
MDDADIRQCFGCHSTGGVRDNRMVFEKLNKGVGCEGCHGPAAEHVNNRTRMRRLQTLTTEEMSDFCGRCHRTWAQVASGKLRGPNNVRFQPYRLTNSRCYDAADARIRCTACHDPHGEVKRAASAYDSKCLSCHGEASAGKCPLAAENCSSCHMPKVELPGAHFRFTDHQIRIARKNDPYPN